MEEPSLRLNEQQQEKPLSEVDGPKGENDLMLLTKDRKSICRVKCENPQTFMPPIWDITEIIKKDTLPSGLHHTYLYPAYEDKHQHIEWGKFLNFLRQYKKVAVARTDECQFYILPPREDEELKHAVLFYLRDDRHTVLHSHSGVKSEMKSRHNRFQFASSGKPSSNTHMHAKLMSHLDDSINCKIEDSTTCESEEIMGDEHSLQSGIESSPRSRPSATARLGKNFVSAHPSYLKTLGQSHSSWIFGAIAELVDNSRDAKANILNISIETIYWSFTGKEIPMLAVIDDGHGMGHEEILRMVSFGRKNPDTDDRDYIGRFGVGFKSGAMRLGKDALVLTQTTNSRSIAFLSQSFNEGKDNIEIPIVTYSRREQFMEVDTSVQSEALSKDYLKAIMKFSPFNKYLIGEKAGLFKRKGTGTQIYIWNLDEWGTNYCLQWEDGINGGSSFHQGDILIRSRRARSRPGQMTRQVPLDFSLRSYLEVIFLDPRMKIFVQGSLIKSRPLAKFLHKTCAANDVILGKPVELILGYSQLEWEQGNCGIFLYWHGRLIEAYKRVGSMIHNGEKSHGIIGVIDVTDVMSDGSGHVWVHNNKQAFEDCEAYAQLEEWLGKKADEYLDDNFDKIQLQKGGSLYKPDNEWVQCDKCRKWRTLPSDFDSKTLPQEWFCYMKPFNGKCEMPEHKVARGVITVSSKRSGYSLQENQVEEKEELLDESRRRSQGKGNSPGPKLEGNGLDDQPRKRCGRSRLPRHCKKNKPYI